MARCRRRGFQGDARQLATGALPVRASSSPCAPRARPATGGVRARRGRRGWSRRRCRPQSREGRGEVRDRIDRRDRVTTAPIAATAVVGAMRCSRFLIAFRKLHMDPVCGVMGHRCRTVGYCPASARFSFTSHSVRRRLGRQWRHDGARDQGIDARDVSRLAGVRREAQRGVGRLLLQLLSRRHRDDQEGRTWVARPSRGG